MSDVNNLVEILKRHDKIQCGGKSEELSQLNNILNPFSYQIERVYKQKDKIGKTEKTHFNLLKILTKHHLEELHTSFLAYLLDPKGDHDFQAEFLEAFVSVIEQELVESALPVPTKHQIKNA